MASIDVEHVLSRMTDREKLSLLAGINFWHTRPIPKYGMRSLRLSDGPNGARGTRFFNSVPASCLPCGTALGATFDEGLLYEAGRLMAKEAKAKGAHVILGPTINIEDPVVAGTIVASSINGMQSLKVFSALKHFVCNDQEHERNKVNTVVAERALREIYLLSFQIAIRELRPKVIMTSYNKINGVHVAEDKKFLQDILRSEWKWNGLIVSDWFGTYSTSESINAGLDLEMPGPTRWRGEAAFVAATTDKLYPNAIDDRVRALLNLINEYEGSNVPNNAPEITIESPETSSLLRRLASESIVLMKNSLGVLPLRKDKRTLVIGPNASVAAYCGGGSAALRASYTITPLNAIRNKVSEEVAFTIGAQSHRELPDLGTLLLPTLYASEKGVTFKAYNEPPEIENRKELDTLKFKTANMMFMDYNNPELKDFWYTDIEGYC
ncbi:hypothetical protein BS50DRAFT_638905 [Corynespora cassiicola Philippines]|uniref:beta-glucosidase n=1 Tax=Corynespora cassiicola Philippines TaxID=1448308 RepID=A0A2T2N897_CORCC|nr:hypothetical protein BS50DRAFT_638905 [Corynespora cassiicola Philippines]